LYVAPWSSSVGLIVKRLAESISFPSPGVTIVAALSPTAAPSRDQTMDAAGRDPIARHTNSDASPAMTSAIGEPSIETEVGGTKLRQRNKHIFSDYDRSSANK